MVADSGSCVLSDPQETIRSLQLELEQTNREVMALTLELEQRVDERTAELRVAQDELQKTNSELLQLTLELEERVAQRTAELANANASLRSEIARRQAVEAEIRSLNAELERRVQKRTSELAAANKELEAFSYSVSHDLRAPLRSIDGFSQALLEDCAHALDAEGTGHLQRIRGAARRMAELIDALLSLSRVTRTEVRLERVDLSALARTTAGELQQRDPDRRGEFVIAEGLAVTGDLRLLRVALENLLGNAWKFTAHRPAARIEFGSISNVEFGMRNAESRSSEGTGHSAIRNPQSAIYFVRDNGAGFDMAYADKLFGAFQRLHTQAEFGGIGIGLATVRRVIQRHGGQTWAEGEIDKGATFYFTLVQ